MLREESHDEADIELLTPSEQRAMHRLTDLDGLIARSDPATWRLKMAVATLLTICIVLLIALFTVSFMPHGPAVSVCMTEDCVKLAGNALSSMDLTADPCEDFYQFSCGNWMNTFELPGDRSSWTRSFNEIDRTNSLFLRRTLDQNGLNIAAMGDNCTCSPLLRSLNDAYQACLNESLIESLGTAPFSALSDQVLSGADFPFSLNYVVRVIARLHAMGNGVFFNIAVYPDEKQPQVYAAHIGQDGLYLPDRDYYLSADAPKTLTAYRAHITNLFVLLNRTDVESNQLADSTISIETAMANAFVPKDHLRDPDATYNLRTLSQLHALQSLFPWDVYFAELKQLTNMTVSFDNFIVENVAYMQFVTNLIVQTDTMKLLSYLEWHLLSSYVNRMPDVFVQKNFEFNKLVFGTKSLPVRWKTCVNEAQNTLGFVLSKTYVESLFEGESRQTAADMIRRIKDAFQLGLSRLSWMDAETQKKAADKKNAVTDKIGYPDWMNDDAKLTEYYGNLPSKLSSKTYLNNKAVTASFAVSKSYNRLGQPVDKTDWEMLPSEVNAYYNPVANEIVFPAGIMQPPFFDKDFPKYVNFGGLGVVMGHELTHGFDDQGRQFSATGTLTPWWSSSAVNQFTDRANCVRDQYSSYRHGEFNLNGALTLGENIADNGGLKESLVAYRQWVGENGAEVGLPGINLTNEQMFFVSFAQIWCNTALPQEVRRRVLTDPHSPGKYRVIGSVSNSKEFAEVFKCPQNSAMNPSKKCEVW